MVYKSIKSLLTIASEQTTTHSQYALRGADLSGGDSTFAKIAVVDDHQLFLEGISLVVTNMSEYFQVNSFSDPLQLLESLKDGQEFDLILCDLIMSNMNGLAFIGILRSQSTIPILMLSGINMAPPTDEMRRLGAQGFIHKSADNEALSAAVKTVLAGGEYFVGLSKAGDFEISDRFGDTDRIEEVKDRPIPKLTGRQIEVLSLISQGASNKDISDHLEISENTVKSHLKLIFEELQVNKRTASVRAARTFGLI